MGIGGGGGAPPEGIGGGGGASFDGAAAADLTAGEAGAGDPGVDDEALSMLDKGRGGAMVPKRIDARCLALPPGRSGSSSSSDEDDSAADQSSSSSFGMVRVLAGAAIGSGKDVLALSCCVRRWNGFVDCPLSPVPGDASGGAGAAVACPILLKNGLFEDSGGLVIAGLGAFGADGGGAAGAVLVSLGSS